MASIPPVIPVPPPDRTDWDLIPELRDDLIKRGKLTQAEVDRHQAELHEWLNRPKPIPRCEYCGRIGKHAGSSCPGCGAPR